MNSIKLFFCFAFLFLFFSKTKAQQQVSSQIGVWGVSVVDTTNDLTVPHLSSEKISSGTLENSSTSTPPVERLMNNSDSVLILNTEKQIPATAAPKK